MHTAYFQQSDTTRTWLASRSRELQSVASVHCSPGHLVNLLHSDKAGAHQQGAHPRARVVAVGLLYTIFLLCRRHAFCNRD